MKYRELDTEYGAIFKYNEIFYCIQTPHGAVNLKTGLFMTIHPEKEITKLYAKINVKEIEN